MVNKVTIIVLAGVLCMLIVAAQVEDKKGSVNVLNPDYDDEEFITGINNNLKIPTSLIQSSSKLLNDGYVLACNMNTEECDYYYKEKING